MDNDKDNLININIDMVILENSDINIDINIDLLENIDIQCVQKRNLALRTRGQKALYWQKKDLSRKMRTK